MLRTKWPLRTGRYLLLLLVGLLMSGGTVFAAASDGVSYCQAGKIAIAEFGGAVHSVESDHYHDTPAWEVEIKDSRRGRIEVKVDKATGDILEVEDD